MCVAKSQRVKSAEFIKRQPMALGASDGVFALLAFGIFTPENHPPQAGQVIYIAQFLTTRARLK